MGKPVVDTCDLLCLDLPHAEKIRSSLPGADRIESAAVGARALGDPTRLTIATALLRGNELCVRDVAWLAGHSQRLVSHHLRQLKVAGMATSRRQAQLAMYRLTDRGRLLTQIVVAPDVLVASKQSEA